MPPTATSSSGDTRCSASATMSSSVLMTPKPCCGSFPGVRRSASACAAPAMELRVDVPTGRPHVPARPQAWGGLRRPAVRPRGRGGDALDGEGSGEHEDAPLDGAAGHRRDPVLLFFRVGRRTWDRRRSRWRSHASSRSTAPRCRPSSPPSSSPPPGQPRRRRDRCARRGPRARGLECDLVGAAHGEQFFTYAPVIVFPVSWQDTGSGVFALAAAARPLRTGEQRTQPLRRRHVRRARCDRPVEATARGIRGRPLWRTPDARAALRGLERASSRRQHRRRLPAALRPARSSSGAGSCSCQADPDVDALRGRGCAGRGVHPE